MPKRSNSGITTANETIDLMAASMTGDMTMVISPEAVDRVATAAAWSRKVEISIVDSEGNTHTWLNGAYTTTLSIGNTSTAGTASIASTTLTLTNGRATVIVEGDAAAWVAAETDTLTVGDLTVMGYTVTGGTSVQTFVAA